MLNATTISGIVGKLSFAWIKYACQNSHRLLTIRFIDSAGLERSVYTIELYYTPAVLLPDIVHKQMQPCLGMENLRWHQIYLLHHTTCLIVLSHLHHERGYSTQESNGYVDYEDRFETAKM